MIRIFIRWGRARWKYNLRLNEDVARLPGLAQLHPLTDGEGSQVLALMYTLQQWLAEISGLAVVWRQQPGHTVSWLVF
ncbi:MAG: hypothetical protein R3E39_27590 [Anaerolineae bacterium]